MKTAFIIFDQMTSLDLIGVYDPLTRLSSMNFMPNFEWDFCSFTADVRDDKGLKFTADKIANPLSEYDHIVIPGGFGTRELQHDHNFLEWLKTASSVKLKASVCTGSLLLGSAGFLKGKKATTNPNAFEQLKPYCAKVLDQRVVDEEEIITARGVTSSIDLGLYLVKKFTNAQTQKEIAKQMDYTWLEA